MTTDEHLSFSRADLFDRCRRAYRFRYRDKLPSLPVPERDFGKCIHAVCERLVGEHVEEQRVGRLEEVRAFELYEEEFFRADLRGGRLFEEGFPILRQFVADEGVLDFQQVLALEKPFELTIGSSKVVGFIDRIDRIGPDAIRVDDYKNYRNPTSREEIDSSLQLSLYALAAKKLYPWAKRIELGLRFLRHGFRMSTERTEEQLAAAAVYFAGIGQALEREEAFEPSLSPLCAWCDYRGSCADYQAVVTGRRPLPMLPAGSLDEVVRARQEAATVARLASARQKELDDVLKTALRDQEAIEADGHRYTMLVTKSRSYPLTDTAETLATATGLGVPEVLRAIASVDNDKLTAWFKKADLSSSDALVLRAEVDALASVRHSTRLFEKRVGAQ